MSGLSKLSQKLAPKTKAAAVQPEENKAPKSGQLLAPKTKAKIMAALKEAAHDFGSDSETNSYSESDEREDELIEENERLAEEHAKLARAAIAIGEKYEALEKQNAELLTKLDKLQKTIDDKAASKAARAKAEKEKVKVEEKVEAVQAKLEAKAETE